MRYLIIINPPEYRDNGDDTQGFAWAGEAKDEDEAFELACIDCEVTNGWDEGDVDRDDTDVIKCNPDWGHFVENVKKYNARLNELEIAPNGDDYNALLDLIEGGAYVEPHVEGR